MIRTIILCSNGNCKKILQLEMDDECRDLRETLRKAALAYCRTQEGHKVFLERGGLGLEDFFARVPEAVCKKYGIRKISAITPEIVADSAERLVSSSDAVCLTEHFDSPLCQKGDVCAAAVRLAEMWGIMETLDGQDVLSVCGTERNTSRLIAWAEEYVSDGKDDLRAFFEEKLEDLRK